MKCNCHVLFDQDCTGSGHDEERRRRRTAIFDFLKCKAIENVEWPDEGK